MPVWDQESGSSVDLARLRRRLDGWRPDRVGTLMFLTRDDQVLLIRKRRGHGAGKINGPGGKPERGESAEQCVVRETREEVGVRVVAPRLAAVLRFLDLVDADWLGFVYRSDGYSGEPRASAEALPAWYPVGALPFAEMWEDDCYWLPRVLAGERLQGDFLFTGGRLLAHRLRAVPGDEAFAAG